MFVYILGNDIIEQNLQFEAESYDFECDNDDFDVAVARRLERLRRRSGQRSGDSHRSLDFKTASQSLQSPQSLEWLQKKIFGWRFFLGLC